MNEIYILQLSLYPYTKDFDKDNIDFSNVCIKARVAYSTLEFLNNTLEIIKSLHLATGYSYDNTYDKEGILLYIPSDLKAPVVIINIIKIPKDPDFEKLAKIIAFGESDSVKISDTFGTVKQDIKADDKIITMDEIKNRLSRKKKV